MKARGRYLLILATVLSLFSCDKLCKKTLEEVASVQNLTVRELSLKVCIGKQVSEVVMNLSADSTLNEVSLGTRESSEVRGGPTANCSSVSSGKSTVIISLAPSSFGTVKLCYDDINRRNIITENDQMCPAGYLEQTSTGLCGI